MTTRAGRWPPGVLAPAAVGGVLFGPGTQVVDALFDGAAWNWREVVLAGLFFAVASGLANAVSPAVSASARERAAVSRAVARAVSSGVLPGGAGPEWADLLAAEVSRLRTTRTGVPAVATLLAVAVAAIALQVQDRTVWLCVAVLVLAGALTAVWTDRRLRAVERLAAAAGSHARV